MKNVKEILINLGLTENEILVFLAAVKAGLSPISSVARQAGITRTYVYEIIEELKRKGLLAETKHAKIKKIQALDYGGLLSYIQRKQKDMQILEKELVKAEGEFLALRSGLPQKTKVRFFEGTEGIKSINAEIKRDLEELKQQYQFYVVFSPDRMDATLPGWVEHNQHIYFEPFMQKFAIISDTPLLKRFLEEVTVGKQNNFHYRIWPQEKLEFPTDTLCWQNKIAYLDMKGNPSGIIIESDSIVQTFIMWFKQIWENLK